MTTTTRTPLSPVQRSKLMELITAVYGVADDAAAAQLEELCRDEFQVATAAASYEQGARLTGILLRELRNKANSNDASPAPAPAVHPTPAEPAAPLETAPLAPPPAPTPMQTIISGEASFSWNTHATDESGWEEQFTVRAATGKELLERVGALKAHLTKHGYTPTARRSRPNVSSADPADSEAAPLCAIHKTSLVKRSKDGRSWWSCPQKLDDGTWCPYKPR